MMLSVLNTPGIQMQVLKRNKNILEYSRHTFFGQTQNIHISIF